jgi:sulfhydrogenase subunit beta (sulfur reductase)
MQYLSITKEEWDKTLERLLLSYTIFATVRNESGIEYELVNPSNITTISYNKPKPVTSLKTFFLPVRENVTSAISPGKRRIIMGIPNCDIAGLKLLDEIYLDKDFKDIYYRDRRENSVLISSDCFGVQEHCHCLTYDIKPYSTSNSDLAVIHLGDLIILRIITSRGKEFLSQFSLVKPMKDQSLVSEIEKEHKATEALLLSSNKGLPGYSETGKLLRNAGDEIWRKYSAKCVSCGACATICPTCSCFLLIDKPGFEKVKQLDACQYPGFERVAGGEDALFEIHRRFRNRYMCKYVWKPEKFKPVACTGCGRCIEACPGKINKNELFLELAHDRS